MWSISDGILDYAVCVQPFILLKMQSPFEAPLLGLPVQQRWRLSFTFILP